MFKNRQGFTLVELAIVIVIIGTLAIFGLPKLRDAVEKAKSVKAFNYLSAVYSSQEDYFAEHDRYASSLFDLDIAVDEPEGFEISEIALLSGGWSQMLRREKGIGLYGAYTLIFNQDGFDILNSTVADDDHKPIHPIQIGVSSF
ncbi:MAG: type II secretion system protein [bacterium]|nr:type II secretion system protein [bacterium]